MAINANFLRKGLDRKLFWATALLFPVFILIGFARSYYLSAFFDVPPFANALVHIHGLVMTLWVLFFSVQIALIRTRNIKLHMTLGTLGIGLAAAVVIVGLMTAYDSLLVRASPIDGMSPHSFLIFPFTSLMMFVALFAAAIFYRKSPAEHKALMFLTAVNFLPFAFSRMPFIPAQFQIPWAFGGPDLIGIGVFIWVSVKQWKINKAFAVGLFLMILSQPLRIMLMDSPLWLNAVALIAPGK